MKNGKSNVSDMHVIKRNGKKEIMKINIYASLLFIQPDEGINFSKFG